MSDTHRFRVSLCQSTFTEVEVEATSAVAAEIASRQLSSRVKFVTYPAAFRVERRVPAPGRPGEFQWVEERGE